jgi:hypothetical protein
MPHGPVHHPGFWPFAIEPVMKRALVTTVLAAATVIGGAWVYARRETIRRQYACHRVAVASSYPEAMRELAWFEAAGPDREARLRELVAAWGRGDPRFDYYLARYLRAPQCSEGLREVFSQELSWRPGLRARWAHFWSWQSAREPGEELATLRSYLDAMASSEPPRQVTWRDILDLQALFERTGRGELADRPRPDRWADTYARWVATEGSWPARLDRPALPFPDWKGPPPPRPHKVKETSGSQSDPIGGKSTVGVGGAP